MILLHTLRARNFKQLRDITLDFPDSGAVLIEGHNEAGKSTLFEAAYFALYGKPLDSQATQDELKTYHAEEMSVELAFSVEGRRYLVRRAVRGNQTCSLEWEEDGEAKLLRNANPVNQRIREEIGLSASTLLNTCFVAQKNLERLESLNADQRRDAINELLNLRVLSLLESEFRVTAEDRREKDRLRDRLEVAKLDDEYPRLRDAEHEASACAQFARLSELWRQREAWTEESDGLLAERDTLAGDLAEVDGRLSEARGIASRLEGLGTGLALRLGQWKTEAEHAHRAAVRVEALERDAGSLTEVQERLDAAEAAADRLRERDEARREERRIAAALEMDRRTLGTERNREAQWRERIEAVRASLPALEESCRATGSSARAAERTAAEAELRETLLAWAEAMERSGESGPGSAANRTDLDEREARARSQEAEAKSEARAAARRARAAWAAAGASVPTAATAIALPSLLAVLLVLALALAGAGAAVAMKATRAARAALDAAQAAMRELDGIEGERRAFAAQADQAAKDSGAWQARAESASRRIRDLGFAVPESAAAARNACDGMTSVSASDARSAAEAAAATFRGESSKLEARRSRLEADLASPVEVSAEFPDRVESQAAQLAMAQAQLAEMEDVDDALEALGLEPDTLECELDALRESAASSRAAARDLPSAQLEAERHDTAADRNRTEAQQEWAALVPEAPMPADPEPCLALVKRTAESLAESLARADVERLERQRETLAEGIREIDVSRAALASRIADAARQLASLMRLAAGLGWSTQDDANVDGAALTTIRTAHPELTRVDSRSADEWSAIHDRARVQAQSNRETRATQAARAGIDEALLDLNEAKAELGEAVRAMNVKLRATEIVRATRASIVSRVMPLTLQNMRRMLPLLTGGRYHDVEWNEESNALTVFDNEARRHVAKRVFSGGARDQISLSLRLAFALATLPGEYSTRPGWLFLDEPLSSFDRDRTQCLVDLLTKGLVRQQFAQILLVSHSESFDPAQFDSRLRMEAGQIVSGTVPAAESEPALV